MPVDLPPRAVEYVPVLRAEVSAHWPGFSIPQVFAGQVEQETCPSLKSVKCWNPRAELKTSREYGFGLGQLTVTEKFDNFKAAKQLDKSLSGWEWDSRYNAAFQLRTLVLMDKFSFGKAAFAATESDRIAMMLSAYNGGLGGLLSDRKVCLATQGCDPSRWFGHVELTSKKSRVKYKGYGKSFFDINREYPVNILSRMRKYEPLFKESR